MVIAVMIQICNQVCIRVFIFLIEHVVILAFRGTIPSSWQNWATDLDVFFTSPQQYNPVPGAEVHAGFFQAYQNLIQQLGPDMNSLASMYNGAPVLITGHSLGAAIAALTAMDFYAVSGDSSQVTLVCTMIDVSQ